ncbi:hypothetical protein CSUI_002680 [Cystoisospora suis]|uniref:Secreted protein n=1 Tax=Cystoisospora suis TaxID=483139 RepID=A0A2C6L3S5_9APIC|nr:hypothetical protein CSUI_002680 [Cystoisospora suis]
MCLSVCLSLFLKEIQAGCVYRWYPSQLIITLRRFLCKPNTDMRRSSYMKSLNERRAGYIYASCVSMQRHRCCDLLLIACDG